MSVIKARALLERHGMTREQFMALHDLVAKHKHPNKGGQHTNGGCGDGRCDYGSATCSAWTELCSTIARYLPEPLK